MLLHRQPPFCWGKESLLWGPAVRAGRSLPLLPSPVASGVLSSSTKEKSYHNTFFYVSLFENLFANRYRVVGVVNVTSETSLNTDSCHGFVSCCFHFYVGTKKQGTRFKYLKMSWVRLVQSWGT